MSKAVARDAGSKKQHAGTSGRRSGRSRPETEDRWDEARLLAALDGQIPRVRTNVLYQLGLLLVAVALLALPLVYVGIIAGVGYLVYLHAVYDATMLQYGSGRGKILVLFAYLAPIVVGGVLMLFMVKPLFARRRHKTDSLSLKWEDEPRLFAFVTRLAEVVGAPRPGRIDINCDVNASAGFKDGLLAWLRRDLVLTIGLPLVEGLTLRQLAGVIAHEFGHFAQGTGMRITYVIRGVNGWFARTVYERDAWDDVLINAQHNGEHWFIQLLAVLCRLMVWLTRRVLWLLMVVGHGISSFMLRQMEYDADRYEARLAGADAFARTADRMRMLGVGSQVAFGDLDAAWRERRLCDNLPKLISAREADMPEELRTTVRKFSAEQKTGWFDSHPSDASRVAAVRRENAPGLFRHDVPAAVLFDQFERLARRATISFYQQALDRGLRPENLVTTETLVEAHGKKKQDHAALRRYFQDLVHPVCPVPLPSVSPFARRALDADAAAEIIFAARSKLAESLPEATAALEAFRRADRGAVGVERFKALGGGGVRRVDLSTIDLVEGDEAAPYATARKYQAEMAAARAVLNDVLGENVTRLLAALELAKAAAAPATPAGAVAKDDPEEFPLADESDDGTYGLAGDGAAGSADRLMDALRAIVNAAPGLDRLRRAYHVLGTLLSHCREEGTPEPLVLEVLARSKAVQQQMSETWDALRRVPYPYDHADKQASIGRFALEQVPPPDAVIAVAQSAESMLEAVYGLYMRVLSDLARQAEEVESSLGLPPLPEPPQRTAEE